MRSGSSQGQHFPSTNLGAIHSFVVLSGSRTDQDSRHLVNSAFWLSIFLGGPLCFVGHAATWPPLGPRCDFFSTLCPWESWIRWFVGTTGTKTSGGSLSRGMAKLQLEDHGELEALKDLHKISQDYISYNHIGILWQRWLLGISCRCWTTLKTHAVVLEACPPGGSCWCCSSKLRNARFEECLKPFSRSTAEKTWSIWRLRPKKSQSCLWKSRWHCRRALLKILELQRAWY